MGPIAGAALGIGTGMIQDLWQLGIGNQMADQQMGRNKHMMNFQMEKMLEMWQKTGYGPTVEAIKKAGLNPALLYGMGGAGGQTAQGPTASTTMPNTPTHDNVGMGMQIAQQQKIVDANVKNIEADTALKNTQAGKLGGVDTKEAETRIDLNTQEITNKKAQVLLIQAEEAVKHLDARFLAGTIEDRMKDVEYNVSRSLRLLQLSDLEQKMAAETYENRKQQIVNEGIKSALENALITAETGATIVRTALDQQKIKESIHTIMQNWDKLDKEGQRQVIEDALKHYNMDPTADVMRNLTNTITAILAGIAITRTTFGPNRTPIGFKTGQK